MDPIALEETWKTQRWPCRPFQFLLAVTEQNVRLAQQNIYDQKAKSQQHFRKEFAKELLYNPYCVAKKDSPRKKRRKINLDAHKIVSIKKFHTFAKNGKFRRCATEYIQLKCINRCDKTRRYCLCTPGRMLCEDCAREHLVEAAMDG